MEMQVRNGWMGMWCATLLALGMMLSLPAAAQSMKTAEGAQQFLSEMARKMQTRVHYMDAAGRPNYVTGK
jgi:hypothetical protein